jgi:hypothetical protein
MAPAIKMTAASSKAAARPTRCFIHPAAAAATPPEMQAAMFRIP